MNTNRKWKGGYHFKQHQAWFNSPEGLPPLRSSVFSQLGPSDVPRRGERDTTLSSEFVLHYLKSSYFRYKWAMRYSARNWFGRVNMKFPTRPLFCTAKKLTPDTAGGCGTQCHKGLNVSLILYRRKHYWWSLILGVLPRWVSGLQPFSFSLW